MSSENKHEPFPRFIDAPLKDKVLTSIQETNCLRGIIKPSLKDLLIEALKDVEGLKRKLHRILNS